MKYFLLCLLWTTSKTAVRVILINVVFMGTLYAHGDPRAQSVKSIRDVYINLKLKDSRIKDVYRSLETTAYQFNCKQEDIDHSLGISGSFTNSSIANLGLEVSKRNAENESILVTELESNSRIGMVVSPNQDITITGKVTSADDNTSLPGANVIIKGTNQGTVTDVDGNYKIDVPSSESILVFSFVGYIQEEVTVGNRRVIDLTMAPDVQSLQEVVVIGYGQTEKRDLTGAISQLKGSEINELPVSGFDEAIQGKVSGVRVINSNAAPGGGFDIQIRGIGSITGSSYPLVVVDGMPLPDESYQAENNPFNVVNPNDIASVEVLKDASAAAIYGARASNGVILITTKKGKGKTKIKFDMNHGFVQNINIPEMGNADTYGTWFDNMRNMSAYRKDPAGYNPDVQPSFDFFVNTQEEFEKRQADLIPLGIINSDSRAMNYFSYDPAVNSQAAIDVINMMFNDQTPYEGVDTYWMDAIQNDGAFPGSQANYDISASGSSDKTRYFISGSYFDQKGIIRKTDYTRYTVNVNVDFDITDWLRVGTKLSPSWQELNNVGGSRISDRWFSSPLYQTALLMPPNLTPYDPDGSISDYSQSSPYAKDYFGWGTVGFLGNPLYTFVLTDNQKTFRTLGNFWAEATLFKGLKFRSALSVDYSNAKNISFQPSTYGDRFSSPGPQNLTEDKVNATHRDAERIKTYWENTLTYDKTFDSGHNLNAVVGFTQEKTNYNYVFVQKYGFSSDDVQLPAGGSTVRDPSGDATDGASQDAFVGVFGRLQYNYKHKYYLTGSYRRDGSSRFGSETLWGNFPSLAAAWNLSEEPFMRNFSFLDNLKLRASYGITGNSSIPSGQQQRILSYNSYIIDNQLKAGLQDAHLYDPNLGWERTREGNLGVDVAFIQGRLSFTGEVYKRNTTDMLLSVDLPNYVGFGSVLTNFGEMENKGFELTLTGVPVAGPLTWEISGNISQNRGKVTQLFPEANQFITGQSVAGLTATRAYVGGPMSLFWGNIYDGIFNDWNEVYTQPSLFNYSNGNLANMSRNSSHPGETKIVDVNGDGVLDGNDDTIIGNPWPDFYWGLSNMVRYKNFDLYVQMDGVIGAQVYNFVKSEWYKNASRGFNMPQSYLDDYWTPENTDAKYPIISTRDGQSRGLLGGSSLLVESGDYVAFRTVRLGYSFPQSIINAKYISRLRIYATVQNALYLTKYEGFNPEGNNQGASSSSRAKNYGVDAGNYPISRTVTVGIDLEF